MDIKSIVVHLVWVPTLLVGREGQSYEKGGGICYTDTFQAWARLCSQAVRTNIGRRSRDRSPFLILT